MAYFAYTKYSSWKARRPSSGPKFELSGAEEIAELHHHHVRELDGKLVSEMASPSLSELATPVVELEAKN